MAWYNPFTWFSGAGNTRRVGQQTSTPDSYSSDPAATVNFDTAMTVSAFWACTRVLTETVGAMPINCYRNMPDGSREIDTKYPIWRLLNFQPNRYQTRNEFFESIMLNLCTDGNAFIRVVGNRRDRISTLLPLMSAQMGVYLMEDGSLEYNYQNANGTYTVYKDSEIWHIKLFGNSIVGMSPLAYARNSLGISLATENRVGKLASNGGKATGVLSVDRILTSEQRAAIRENFKEIASGDSDSIKVLEADMKFQQISLSPNDLQMLENRRFNVEDICRFMGVPSVLVNDTQVSTVWGSGIQEIIKGFYKINLTPYLERIESSTTRWLIPVSDWGKVEIEFNFDSLLRADPKERAERDSIRINSGQITPNESRNGEGLLDKEGGDELLVNGSLQKVADVGKQPAQPVLEPQEAENNEND